MHLDALVIAIGRAPRVRDLRDLARGRLHHHGGGVDIAGLADRLVDEGGTEREDLDRLLGQEEARHVEVVDHHVAEEPARAPDVVDRRRRGIARDHGDDLDRAGLARAQTLLQRGEIRVEAAVEADHQRLARFLDRRQAAADAGGVEIDRLLAEHGLAGRDSLLDQIGMGVGRRADQDGVDRRIGEDRLRARRLGAGRGGERGGSLRHRVGDGDEFGIAARGDVQPVDAPDAAGAQQSDLHGRLQSYGPSAGRPAANMAGALVMRAEDGLVEIDVGAGHQPDLSEAR